MGVALAFLLSRLRQLDRREALSPDMAEMLRAPGISAEQLYGLYWDVYASLMEGTRAAASVDWFVYRAVPESLFDEVDYKPARVAAALDGYYRRRWCAIRQDMLQRLDTYDISRDCKAVFRQAVSAHDTELYRASCPMLFPAIESALDSRPLRGERLEAFFESREQPADALASRTLYMLVPTVLGHVYVSGRQSAATLDRFASCDIPNRHAALHGCTFYKTHKHSMNMLIMADCLFELLSSPLDRD